VEEKRDNVERVREKRDKYEGRRAGKEYWVDKKEKYEKN
jgi:hypothetical protein